MLRLNRHRQTISFTLLELLIVIGILGIFGVISVLVLNPTELFNQARDANRISEIININKAVKIYQRLGAPVQETPNIVYIALPDTSPPCAILTLPPLPAGWQYQCKTSSNYRRMDGNGWIPVNFTSISSGSPFSTLPIDPINSATDNLYYAYVNGGGVIEGWVLTSLLQSDKYLQKNGSADKGMDPARFEVGNSELWAQAIGLVGYWPFDEGSGVTSADASPYNNEATFLGGTSWNDGKVNKGASFDGVSGRILLGGDDTFKSLTQGSVYGWFWLDDLVPAARYIFETGPKTANSFGLFFWIDVEQDGHIEIRHRNTDGTFDNIVAFTSAGSVSAGKWYQYVWTVDATIGNAFYLNGERQNITYGGGSPSTNVYFDDIQTTENYFLGVRKYRGILDYYHKGIMDEMRLYNRALGASEIKAMYNAEK